MSEEKEIASVVPENPENSETISEDISAEIFGDEKKEPETAAEPETPPPPADNKIDNAAAEAAAGVLIVVIDSLVVSTARIFGRRIEPANTDERNALEAAAVPVVKKYGLLLPVELVFLGTLAAVYIPKFAAEPAVQATAPPQVEKKRKRGRPRKKV